MIAFLWIAISKYSIFIDCRVDDDEEVSVLNSGAQAAAQAALVKEWGWNTINLEVIERKRRPWKSLGGGSSSLM